jgi:hypothetical protein
MHRMLAVVALLALPPAVAAQTPVPLEVADGGYLYVRARVADSVDARLLLDTGAGINTLSESVLGRLGDRVRDAGTHTGTRHNGETITGRIWSVSSLALGALRKENVVVGGFAPRGADGMLSMDFFRDQPFTLDFAAGTLTLESPSHVTEIASRAAGPMEYYVHSTFLPELHYCAAPAVRVEKQFVGFKAGLIYEGLVGHGAFRDRKLTIDIPRKRMLVW